LFQYTSAASQTWHRAIELSRRFETRPASGFESSRPFVWQMNVAFVFSCLAQPSARMTPEELKSYASYSSVAESPRAA